MGADQPALQTRPGRRAPRDRLPAALAAALATAALGLGGCDALGKLGAMVGLGGGEPAPAPAASPAPGGTPAPPAAGQAPAAPAAASPAPHATVVALAPASSAPATPNAAAAPTSPNPATPAASPGGGVPSTPRLPGTEGVYDPTGKRDPFRPYVTAAALAEQRTRQHLTPLQQVELTQIRLVAIAWGIGSNYAMVEDPGGTGYVLRVGTKVGPNGGRVARITPEAVYVEESFRDAAGAALTNRVILRLPERAGGKGS